MELGGVQVPGAVVVLLAAVLVVDVLLLVDLARHDVDRLPKWVWAIVIVVVSFPLGAILYVLVGRRSAEPGPPPALDPPGRSEVGSAPGSGWPAPVGVPPAAPSTGPSAGPSAGATGASPPPTVIATAGLRRDYGDAVALDGVDLSVARAATYGLIGPNGAGKTTLLSILAGLRQPTGGTLDLAVDRSAVAVLVDTPQFEPWLTAWEVVDLARTLTAPHVPADRVGSVLAEVGLRDAADRRVGGFSRGMLQRLGLAACLVGDPAVLLLDEPSSALDPAGRREVLDLIGRLARDRTVVLSTHVLADVQQVADVVGVLDRGRLVFQGPVEDLLARTSTVHALQVRPPSPALLADLQAQDWVVSAAEPSPGRIRLVVADAVAAGSAVPRLLVAHDVRLVAYTPTTDLETAFLELTGGAR